MVDWISIGELKKRSGHSVSTLRRMVIAKDVSYRRRGTGRRAPLEFNWQIVEDELKARFEVPSRTAVRPADPNMGAVLSMLTEVRDEVRALKEELSPCKS